MVSPFQPGDASSKGGQERTEETDADELTFGALEQILDQTLKLAAEAPPSESGDIDLFEAVARAHAGRALDVDPIVVEMVRAVLASEVGEQLSPAALDNLSQCIAVTLCDDPLSRQRLERLWKRLSERQS